MVSFGMEPAMTMMKTMMTMATIPIMIAFRHGPPSTPTWEGREIHDKPPFMYLSSKKIILLQIIKYIEIIKKINLIDNTIISYSYFLLCFNVFSFLDNLNYSGIANLVISISNYSFNIISQFIDGLFLSLVSLFWSIFS